MRNVVFDSTAMLVTMLLPVAVLLPVTMLLPVIVQLPVHLEQPYTHCLIISSSHHSSCSQPYTADNCLLWRPQESL